MGSAEAVPLALQPWLDLRNLIKRGGTGVGGWNCSETKIGGLLYVLVVNTGGSGQIFVCGL